MWFDGFGWWMIFGGLFMLVFWGGLIALIVWGIIKLSRRGTSTPEHDALEVAKGRYASGEISREEFVQMKKDLS